MIKCWLSDGFYDTADFEQALQRVFGSETRMFEYQDSSMWSRVAVTATTISNAVPYTFSKYNGVIERQGDIGE